MRNYVQLLKRKIFSVGSIDVFVDLIKRGGTNEANVALIDGKKSAKDTLRRYVRLEDPAKRTRNIRARQYQSETARPIGRLTSRRMAPRGIHLPGPRTLHRLSNITWLMGVTRHGANFYTVTAPISTANAIFPSLFLSSLPRIKNTNRDYLAFETVAVSCNGRRWRSYWTGLEESEI